MNRKLRSFLIWVLVTLFTFAIAYYQRTTGPTYDKKGEIIIGDNACKYKLVRSHGGEGDAVCHLLIPDTTVSGFYIYQKINSNEAETRETLKRQGDTLFLAIPHQPPAGKVRYNVFLEKDGREYSLTEEPVVVRFKGYVPLSVLIPHVIIMFLAMIFSTRTGIEALIKGKNTFVFTVITVVLFFTGGLILGPVVQNHAFGAYWTGWPFGHDLTDNKTLVAFIIWMIALIRLFRNRSHRGWVIAAAIILLAVYLVPHSMFGSELDYSTGEVGTGNQ